MQGAGGTEGGLGRFFIGLVLFATGGYLLLDSIRVHSGFGFGHGLYNFGGFSLSTGILLIPFIIGIVLLFYRAKNPVGWILAAGALVALVFGVLRNLRFSLVPMTVFELVLILVLCFGGLGLFLSSLRPSESKF